MSILGSFDITDPKLKALAKMLTEKFTPHPVTPRMSMEQIQYEAGQQSVVAAVFEFLDRPIERVNRLTAAEQRATK